MADAAAGGRDADVPRAGERGASEPPPARKRLLLRFAADENAEAAAEPPGASAVATLLPPEGAPAGPRKESDQYTVTFASLVRASPFLFFGDFVVNFS